VRRRREPLVDPPLAAARLDRLFATPGSGWVPPPAGDGGEAAAPAEPSWSPPQPDDLPPAAEDVPPVRPGGLADLLPETVRGGRLDPGRRGAAALLAVGLLAAAVAAVVVLRGQPSEVVVPEVAASGTPLPGTDEESAPAGGELVVSVAGEVVRPGLVRLPPGSRVDDAVRAAGGLAPGAEVGLLNLARKLVDGEQVLVGVDPPPGTAAPGGAAPGGLLDLNTATSEQLDALPGIGPVLAERIVEWRTEHGGFRSVDQLREVPGIGESKYATLKSKVAA